MSGQYYTNPFEEMNLAYTVSQKLFPVEKPEVSFSSFDAPLDRPFDEEPQAYDDCGGFFRSCVVPKMQESGDSNGTCYDSGDLSFTEDADVDQFLLDTSIATDRLRMRISKSTGDVPMETRSPTSEPRLSGLFGIVNTDLEENSETVTDSAASRLWAEDQSSDELEGTQCQLPLISREGMRKNRSSRFAPDRLRKDSKQVSFLTRLYQLTGGKLDRKQRKLAIKVTGLSWIQIYKWLFDKQLKDNQKCLL